MTIYEVLDSQGDHAAVLDVNDATGEATVLVEGASPSLFGSVAAAVERIRAVGGSVPTLPPDAG